MDSEITSYSIFIRIVVSCVDNSNNRLMKRHPLMELRILLSTNVIGVRAEQGFKPSGEIPNPGCLGPPTAVKFSTN